MKKSLVKRISLILFLALVLGLPAAAAASQYTHIVVFGDSLSDDGNLFALDPSQVDAADYYQGRFSNGPVWVEYLAGADLLDATLINNAYAGATTDGGSVPSVKQQVSTYVAAASALPDALYIIWIGANDFLGGGSDFETSADNVGYALDELATFGSRYARLIVVTQQAFALDGRLDNLKKYPLSHILLVPGLVGKDDTLMPLSDFLLPVVVTLLGTAMRCVQFDPAAREKASS